MIAISFYGNELQCKKHSLEIDDKNIKPVI